MSNKLNQPNANVPLLGGGAVDLSAPKPEPLMQLQSEDGAVIIGAAIEYVRAHVQHAPLHIRKQARDTLIEAVDQAMENAVEVEQ
jgi:hypothetical protein